MNRTFTDGVDDDGAAPSAKKAGDEKEEEEEWGCVNASLFVKGGRAPPVSPPQAATLG
jgi:hypothetical protein